MGKGAQSPSRIAMLPVVARTTIEVLRLVPDSLRYGSYALGISKWRTVLFVVMPSALGRILTWATLAIAQSCRRDGSAPVHDLDLSAESDRDRSSPCDGRSPLLILFDSESPEQSLNDQAWAAAFVLMIFVLILSLTARYVLARRERKLLAR